MTSYRLTYPAAERDRGPVLDAEQRSVVDHPGGPLLVLAGPGTGKTTTLVEAIVDRVETRHTAPDSVLALTFSRKAAEQLRDRVTARLGRTMSTTLSSTFHSFAYGLVRLYAPAELYAAPLRLLSAPEQDVVLQGLLTDAPESVRWPESLRAAVGTRGFAREVQAVLSRARERGLDPEDLERLGREEGLDAYVAAGAFMEQYLTVLGAQSALDYSDLVARAVIEAERHRGELRARFSHVFVDEYQDTDPSQVRLLQSIAGDGRDLVVVGDPDQSIYGFRGAEVRGILDFPTDFRTRDGDRADVVALRTTRRFGSRLLGASRSVVSGLGLSGSIPAEEFWAFRNPAPAESAFGKGRVEVRTYDTARSETEHIADVLRRAHLEDGVPWSQMAVLVRSGRSSIPPLRRSLGAAGVPVEVASDDTPLVREPAVLPLVEALDIAVHAGLSDTAHPAYVGVDRATSLLTSPLAGLDATDVRALARSLRAEELASASAPLSSPELLRRALLEPERLDAVRGSAARRAGRLGRLLVAARESLEQGRTAEEMLWVLWDGTEWPRRLRAGVESGGHAARLAHRDLDAICALFEVAARAEEQQGHTSVESFLALLRAQQIPADTLAESGVRGDAVRLLTAHRAKGLEWRVTVVAHVQDGTWPDLGRRGSLLQPDRIGRDGLLPETTTAALLAEERRLFYVACTRARERLLVTAVRSPEDDGEQPSRFLGELGPNASPQHVQGRPVRPLSMDGLVSELRRTVADSEASEPLRVAAARRLALLARPEPSGAVLAPHADPGSWWGTRAVTRSERPVRPLEEPVTLSASGLEGLLVCPARWFLQREAGGAEVSSSSQGFGSVVHALAHRIERGDIDSAEDLMPYVDQVWGQLTFRTPWSQGRERAAVKAALDRFVAWHNRPGARISIGTEESLTCEVTLPDGQVVRLRGEADRLELDEQDRVVVVDFKTGKYAPTRPEVERHAQLGLYQHAVEHGAANHLLPASLAPDRPDEVVSPADRPKVDGAGRSGGAELIQLRKGQDLPLVQAQPRQQSGADGSTLVEQQLMQAANAVRTEDFAARPGDHCRTCSFHALCPAKTSGTVLS